MAIAIFITNNLIPGRNSEISAFTFTFAKRGNNLSEHPTTESTLLEEEALFKFFLPKDVLWMNVMFSCYALSCWAQFYILTDSTPGAKTFFLFSKFLIIRGAVYLLKNVAEWCFVWHSRFDWQYLVWPGTERKFFLILLTSKNIANMCTSQLTSVLFIFFKLEVYFFG